MKARKVGRRVQITESGDDVRGAFACIEDAAREVVDGEG